MKDREKSPNLALGESGWELEERKSRKIWEKTNLEG